MRFEWLACTRPDCQLEISQLAQVTEERFLKNHCSLIRRMKAIRVLLTIDFTYKSQTFITSPLVLLILQIPLLQITIICLLSSAIFDFFPTSMVALSQ